MSRNKHINCDPLDRRMEVSKAQKGEDIDLRKFDPSTYGFRPDALPSDVLVSDPKCCPLVHVKVDEKREFNFALYADGACVRNGTEAARASVGVYGTPDAWYNDGARLPSYLPQTNQSAEIYSAIAAIKIARAILKDRRPDFGKCGCESMVVLLMDSKYVVDAMTDWIRKWRANGFLNARGMPVKNGEAFKRLDYDISQAYLNRYIIVRFWHVPRIYNSGADMMAAQALRGNRFLDLSPADYDSDDDSEVCSAFSGLQVAYVGANRLV